ncbi:MAG: helix-turn-helix transcriptional regulator [Archangium sp.]
MRQHGLVRHRSALRAVLDVATSDTRDEARWSSAICESTAASVPDALGVGLQHFTFDASLHVLSARQWGVGILTTLDDAETLRVAQSAPRALLSQLRHARTSAVMLPPELLSSAVDVDVKSAALLVSQPGEGHAMVLILKLPRRHRLTPHEQQLFTRLRLSLEAGADALRNTRVEGTWSLDANPLDGHLDADALWRGLISGRYRLQLTGSGPTRHLRVLENPPHLRAARRLSEHETQVIELCARGLTGKQQSWELQRSTSAVSRLLASASARLGFVYVNDAIRFFGGLLHRPVVTLDVLTPSERDVLSLVQQGLSNHEIALQRSRSVRTVANQVAAVLKKTGAPSRRALFPLRLEPS